MYELRSTTVLCFHFIIADELKSLTTRRDTSRSAKTSITGPINDLRMSFVRIAAPAAILNKRATFFFSFASVRTKDIDASLIRRHKLLGAQYNIRNFEYCCSPFLVPRL